MDSKTLKSIWMSTYENINLNNRTQCLAKAQCDLEHVMNALVQRYKLSQPEEQIVMRLCQLDLGARFMRPKEREEFNNQITSLGFTP